MVEDGTKKTHLFGQMLEILDALDLAVLGVRPSVRIQHLDDDLRRVLQEPVFDLLDDFGAGVGGGGRRRRCP